jgi:hypothetical protein
MYMYTRYMIHSHMYDNAKVMGAKAESMVELLKERIEAYDAIHHE